jgi:hypothetical protein
MQLLFKTLKIVHAGQVNWLPGPLFTPLLNVFSKPLGGWTMQKEVSVAQFHG